MANGNGSGTHWAHGLDAGHSPIPGSPRPLFPPPPGLGEHQRGFSTPRGASDDRAAMLQRDSWRLEDFEIGPKLGEGRFGKIYLCREKVTKYAVVLKLIAKEAVFHHDLMHQIQREVELHMYCRHRHILRMLAYFWDDERIFLVLDYADDGNLTQLLSTIPQGSRLSERAVRLYTAQLLTAVHYLHRRGILHRDIKPENILFKKGQLKLADFTWAVFLPPHAPATAVGGAMSPLGGGPRPRAASPGGWSPYSAAGGTLSLAARRRRRMTICGTIDYLPPEMVRRRAYDEAADMWSVGVTVYEMLVGVPPFESPSIRGTEARIAEGAFQFPRLVRDQLSWEAKDFVARLLQVDPQVRMTAADAVHHPFIASMVAEEKRNSTARGGGSRSQSRSRSRDSRVAPPLPSDWTALLAAGNGEQAGGGSSGRDWRLQYSGVSVSACTTMLGGSSTNGPHGGNPLPSMVGSNNVSGVLNHTVSGLGAGPHPTGMTTLMVSNVLPSSSHTVSSHFTDVTASTQEGHDDAPAHEPAADAEPAPRAAAADTNVERVLHFDMEREDNHKAAGNSCTDDGGSEATAALAARGAIEGDVACLGGGSPPPSDGGRGGACTPRDDIEEDALLESTVASVDITAITHCPQDEQGRTLDATDEVDGSFTF